MNSWSVMEQPGSVLTASVHSHWLTPMPGQSAPPYRVLNFVNITPASMGCSECSWEISGPQMAKERFLRKKLVISSQDAKTWPLEWIQRRKKETTPRFICQPVFERSVKGMQKANPPFCHFGFICYPEFTGLPGILVKNSRFPIYSKCSISTLLAECQTLI